MKNLKNAKKLRPTLTQRSEESIRESQRLLRQVRAILAGQRTAALDSAWRFSGKRYGQQTARLVALTE